MEWLCVCVFALYRWYHSADFIILRLRWLKPATVFQVGRWGWRKTNVLLYWSGKWFKVPADWTRLKETWPLWVWRGRLKLCLGLSPSCRHKTPRGGGRHWGVWAGSGRRCLLLYLTSTAESRSTEYGYYGKYTGYMCIGLFMQYWERSVYWTAHPVPGSRESQ